jgi:glycosyltransferase involved in cell wall biosynthesis
MRVALNGWFWDQPHTGSGQYLRRLMAGLRKAAPELKLTLVLPGAGEARDIPDGVEMLAVGGGRGNLAKVWFEQRRFPTAVGRANADIAHVPYWGAPLSSPAPLVVSILDAIPVMLPAYTRGFRQKLYVSLQTAAARGATEILTISAAAKADLIDELGLPESRVTVTPLAADEAFHPRMGAERDSGVKEKYGLPDRFVLYLGGFDQRKNVTQLLEAWRYVTKAEGAEVALVIAGAEPVWAEPMFPDLRQAARERDFDDEALRWIGRVDEADLPALYRLAEVFVYPSLYEGFGLPVLEAMASGTPVVANQIPVLEEISGDGAYLVPVGDARKMGGAILALLGQRDLYDTQRSRGLARATHFQWRKTARETLAVYEKALARR